MKKEMYPQIRIKNGWLIYNNVSVHLHKLWGKNKKLATPKEVDKIVASYQKAWNKYEAQILKALYKTTGLKFKQNTIDVYIAPWFKAFSDPMVIGVKFEPDHFVDILTHELLHRLLTDNTKLKNIDLHKEWKKLFGKKHTFKTLVHIPVHAFHKAIILDELEEPERLEREMKKIQEHKATDYLSSWNYVQKNDYKKIIRQLKSIYGK